MKISVAGIYDRGKLDKERVHFRADTDLNLSFFVLLDTVWVDNEQVAAGNHNAFWFGPMQIPRGNHVVVYTRAGTPNVETRADGSVYHFAFRGLAAPQYLLLQASVVLMEVQTWIATTSQTKSLPPLEALPSTIGSMFSFGNPSFGNISTTGSLFGDGSSTGGSEAGRLSDLFNKYKT